LAACKNGGCRKRKAMKIKTDVKAGALNAYLNLKPQAGKTG
jgi:hypothetical protein